MSRELYFLRSSEQKIVEGMFAFAHPNKKNDAAAFEKYTAFYGLSSKDMGLYALLDGKIAGAIWARKFQDEAYASVSVALVDGFFIEDIVPFMMEQFLLEAASEWELLHLDIDANEQTRAFYEGFGFIQKEPKILYKTLEKKELLRPSDGYDPTRWMD